MPYTQPYRNHRSLTMRLLLAPLFNTLFSTLLALALGMDVAVAQTQPTAMRIVGVATAIHQDGSLGATLYREQHDVTPQQHTVIYTDTQGRVLARKQIRYQHGYSTPEFDLQDFMHHTRNGSEWHKGYFLIYQQDGYKQRTTKVIEPDAETAIDAGFDSYIRQHWAELVSGKTVPIKLVVAEPLVVLNLNITEVSAAHTGIPQRSEHYRYFLVNGSNALTRWVLPTLQLAYDRDSHLLQVYQGPSNILGNKGKVQDVNIQYSYTPLPAQQ